MQPKGGTGCKDTQDLESPLQMNFIDMAGDGKIHNKKQQLGTYGWLEEYTVIYPRSKTTNTF